MTPEQYERWRDFALRMAQHGWPNTTHARKQKLVAEVSDFLDHYATWGYAHVAGWDTGSGDLVCDHVAERFSQYDHYDRTDERRDTRFATMIRCCLRAGLDVAAEPSAGVLGFTVGTLRRMYDGTIPCWITDLYDGDLSAAPADASVWL